MSLLRSCRACLSSHVMLGFRGFDDVKTAGIIARAMSRWSLSTFALIRSDSSGNLVRATQKIRPRAKTCFSDLIRVRELMFFTHYFIVSSSNLTCVSSFFLASWLLKLRFPSCCPSSRRSSHGVYGRFCCSGSLPGVRTGGRQQHYHFRTGPSGLAGPHYHLRMDTGRVSETSNNEKQQSV